MTLRTEKMINFLKIISPKWLKTRIYDYVRLRIEENNRINTLLVPKYAIQQETIQNTKLLLSREELLKLLPKEGVVAELGVDEGHFSEIILEICKPQKLHLIDVWESERYNQNKRKSVEENLKAQIDSGIVQIDLGYSTVVGNKFQNNYFDWIYIDTDHSYQTTIDELKVYSSKVKEDGIIAGHDYIIGNWDGMRRYGVIEAVYEFCSKNSWEIIYLTMEHDNHPSFAIRKIK